jgi:DNA-binding protein YbaB
MFGDLMGKLKETQEKVEATKKRMDTVLIDEKSTDALLEDKEQLEDYLILVLNKAITKATNVNEAEVAAVAKDGMPNIPGMDMFK